LKTEFPDPTKTKGFSVMERWKSILHTAVHKIPKGFSLGSLLILLGAGLLAAFQQNTKCIDKPSSFELQQPDDA
jgi:hypothetical protein